MAIKQKRRRCSESETSRTSVSYPQPVRCLITIKRTKLAIEIDGRPRPRAPCSTAAAIGCSSTASHSTASRRSRSSGSSRALIGSTSSHKHSTCPPQSVSITPPTPRETMHEQVNPLKPAGRSRVVLTGPDATLITVGRQERAMPGPGRNEPCPCGSNRKVKHCCGVKRGPSEEQLARTHVALLAREAAVDLQGLSDRALHHLWEQLVDVPAIDLSLLVTLPKLINPDLKRLQESISRDDPDWGWDALTTVAEQVDTPHQRAKLADALFRLRDKHRLNRRQAAAALLDLDSRSTRFIAASPLDAVAISVGSKAPLAAFASPPNLD